MLTSNDDPTLSFSLEYKESCRSDETFQNGMAASLGHARRPRYSQETGRNRARFQERRAGIRLSRSDQIG